MTRNSRSSRRLFVAAQAEAEKYVIPNQFTEVAEANGAHGLNAETGLDDTQYYWSMPENRLELWAWMESGRLADVVPREFYKERDVVMEERRMRVDSDPVGSLIEQFVATAYVAHNYGRSSIGWPSEVGQITATEAMAFHKKYYAGGNVVVAVVGDVDAKTAMPILEKYFSRVPAGPKPEEMTTVEPKQFAEKSVVIREQTQPFYIEGYHRPSNQIPTTRCTTPLPTSCRMGACRDSIAASWSSNRLRPRQKDSVPSPAKNIPASLRFMLFRCPATLPPRCEMPFTKKSKS